MNSPVDQLQRFVLARAGVSGVLVQLAESWREVAGRAPYPEVVQRLLGEALAASAVLTGNIKFEGSLSLQLKSGGPVPLLFAQCTDRGELRGLAQWQPELPATLDLARLRTPLLAITIENSRNGQRYQGLVPVESANLGTLLETYFERSEQLPTHIALACDGTRCAALMVQKVARDGGTDAADPDGWNRVRHLTATLTDRELLELPPEELLRRLYHEELVHMHEPRPLAFGCGCSRDRVSAVLRNLGRSEAEAALQQDGRVEITCEFCNAHYYYDRVDLEQIFRAVVAEPPSPTAH